MATTSNPLAAFAPLIGTWRITGTALDAAGGETLPVRGTEEYAWLPGGEWLIRRVDLVAGDTPSTAIELIGDYDPVRGCLVARSFAADGWLETLTVARRADGAWRLAGDEARGTLHPAPDHRELVARWERRRDDGLWTPWMHLHHTPLAA